MKFPDSYSSKELKDDDSSSSSSSDTDTSSSDDDDDNDQLKNIVDEKERKMKKKLMKKAKKKIDDEKIKMTRNFRQKVIEMDLLDYKPLVDVNRSKGKVKKLKAYRPKWHPLEIEKRFRLSRPSTMCLKEDEVKIEQRIEAIAPVTFEVLFTNIHSSVKLVPGFNNKDAIIKDWIDAIRIHDDIVMQIEEKAVFYLQYHQLFKTVNRKYKNMTAAWMTLNAGGEYKEYKDLRENFDGMMEQEVMDQIADEAERGKTEEEMIKTLKEYERYKELNTWASRVVAFEKQYNEVIAEKDKYHDLYRSYEGDMEALKRQEVKLAANVGIDHEEAIWADIPYKYYHKEIKEGFRMVSINDKNVKGMDFDDILGVIESCGFPQKVQFQRYDYRYHFGMNKWLNLAKLRTEGMLWPDVSNMVQDLLKYASENNLTKLDHMIKVAGVSPGITDCTGTSAMHAAATTGNLEVMEYLVKENAPLTAKNKNMEDVLLLAVKKGHIHIVKYLIQKRMSLNTIDRHKRTPLFHAVLGKNKDMVNFLMEQKPTPILNHQEKHFGWTVLHFAASRGELDLVKIFIEKGSNIFIQSHGGKTPYDVAQDGSQLEVKEYMTDYIQNQLPGQKIIDKKKVHLEAGGDGMEPPGCIWIGSKEAAHPKFATDVNFTAVLSIYTDGVRDNDSGWIDTCPEIKHYKVFVKRARHVESEWDLIVDHLKGCDGFIRECVKEQRTLLIHCDTGNEYAPLALGTYLYTEMKMSFKISLELMKRGRRSIAPSQFSLWGMEDFEEGCKAYKLKKIHHKLRNARITSCAF